MKKWVKWCIVAAILLVLVILGCVFLPRWIRNQKQTIDTQSYYDLKCFSYEIQNFNLAKGQIVFLGDSITDLYVLDDYYSDLHLAVYNRGIGGDCTQGVLDRLQVSVFDLEPSAVILMIGTNDINWGVSEAEIIKNYEMILDAIFQSLPNVKLICMSIIPQNSQLEVNSTIEIAKTTPIIRSVNQQIEAMATEKGATYLDLFSLLEDENHHLVPAYSDDGLHLNSNGFAVWTELLKPHLMMPT